MSPTRSAELAPVFPCIAYNQSSCLSETCAFSHLPDSFSLGSGRRNVCLLSLISRCDGWGCSYSHARDELDWTDQEVRSLVHAHLQLIDAYNGRIARNPPSFHISPSPVPQPVSWTHLTDSQPYPTPASIDPTNLESETLSEPHLAQNSSRSLDEPQITTGDLAQDASPVSPDLVSGENLEGLPNEEKLPRESYEMKTPSAVSLNPLAIPFVPLGYKVVPIDDAPVITPILDPEITPSPVESEICQSPAVGVPSAVAIHDRNEEPETPAWSGETPKVSKVASANDIDAWGAVPGSGSSWDAGPDEDAFKTPPRTAVSPTPTQKHREPVKRKEKQATTSWRDRKFREPQPTSIAQKGKSGGKKPAKFESLSPRQHERRQSTPSVVPSKKSDKRRSLVTVHSEPAVTSSEQWTKGSPQAPEIEDEEMAKSYEIKPQLGSIMPTDWEKPPYFDNIPVAEETATVDPGINWVNGGASRLTRKADPPREFSQRSRPAGSTWGLGSRWPKPSD